MMRLNFKKLICLISIVCITVSTYASIDSIKQYKNEKIISGIIIDIDGIPMPGVNITIKGTGTGVISDINGKYELLVPIKSTITYSFVGYQTQEVIYENQKVINIVLREATQELKDVVIVGYGSQKKASVTGALTLAKPEELQKVSTPSLSNTLGGMVAGVITRQSSGEPGYDQAEILIRGISTWANKNPLVLVDGVERDINLINSQEVESFTVLKDASATAVYGVRGANGVILINTKKGKMGKPQVTLRTEFATLHGLRFPDYINGYEFASLMNEAVSNSGNTTVLPWTQEELVMFRDGTDPYLYPNVNWTNEVLNKNAFQTINNLSVTGGNEIVRYFINVGYTSQSGLFKEDPQYEYRTNSLSSRYNFRSNVDINVTKDLILNLGLGGIIEDRTYPGRSANDIFTAMKKISPVAYARQNPDGSPGGGVSYLMDNPWAMATQSGYAKQFRNTLQGTFGAKYDLSKLVTKGLSISGKFSYDYYYYNEVLRRKEYEVKQYLGKNELGEDQYNVVRPEQAMGYGVSQNSNRAYYLEASINYNRNFENHYITSMLLFNRRDYKNLTAENSTANLPYRRQGLAGRLTYDFDHKYLVEFNFGYNGSENFPKGKRYGFFPSGSIGWIISNEKFWKTSFINHFKLRGTYGTVGNDQVGGDRFLYLSTIDKGVLGYPYGDSQQWIPGYAEAKLGVNNITWEIAKKANIGIDLELFNGLISLQGDFFFENRDNILLKRGVIPNITGITSATIPWANLGKVKNKGFDGTLEIKKTTKRNFYYTFRANFTYARNEIVEDDSAIPKYEYQNTRGHRVNQPFGLVALGFFQDQSDIDNSPKQTFMSTVRPGDIKYKDMNGDNIIDAYDKVAIGYGRTPEIMFGFGATIAYKGFDLTLNFTGATHTSTFLDTEGMYPFMLEFPNYNILREYYDNRWIPGADNSKAKYPAVINGNNPNNYQTNTLYMRNAEYIKLKNAEIGFNFPAFLLKKIYLQGLRIFINGNNLLCFDHLKIIDPESNFGTGGYPTQRTINFGLQVTF